ncbi:nitrate- and nitrite sensing domain-containing protein [Diaphorobacter aerolatus]|uniref:Nitrate- and nitrite sensing domain-containing protein n=2 Tax=Diaphorobacter aerolatus TaxID=1288495 RepID=A0A7H0GQH1_9BURK|nr:nitrate- and nitrite sensing domain-containing protein [Diaphorobacter aerolatus]
MKSPLHYLAAARRAEIAELQQLRNACSIVIRVSALIHQLQKERGLSSLLTASQGVQGAAALAAQRLAVDAGIDDVRNALDVQDTHPHHTARLYHAIAYLLQGLQALPALRASVDALTLTTHESTAAFVRLVGGCLALVFDAADGACDPDVSRLLVAMFHFMQGKELAGQERATGAAAFGSRVNDVQRQRQWLDLIESQEQCFQVFAEFSPPAVRERWQAVSAQGADMATIERLRRVACTALAGDSLDADAGERWFAACSSRLDAMHALEAWITAELARLCADKLETAHSALHALQQPSQQSQECRLADHGGMEFFAVDAPCDLPPRGAAAYGPQIERSIQALVQEQSRRLQLMQAEIDKTRAALAERKTIERAKGVLMHLRQISESDAHKLMRQTAMNQNRRLLDVAQAMLSAADLLP